MIRFVIWAQRLTLACAVLYGLSPYWAAYELHRAIKTGNAAYIDRHVAFESVRASLRVSILQKLGPPDEDLDRPIGWLQSIKLRVKERVAPVVIDAMLKRRVTAEGFIAHMAKRAKPQRKVMQASFGMPHLLVPNGGMLRRILRAKFVDLTTFEFDVRDKIEPEKIYCARFVFGGLGWTMTEVELLAVE